MLARLGGHKVRKARGNADAQDAADVFLYRDSSIAPFLDMRRRFKAVMDVLDAMIRYGISLARSVEFTAQWDKILAVGPLYPVTHHDRSAVQGLDVGEFHRVVSDFHRRLSDFIHAVVAIWGGEIGFGKILWFIHTSGFVLNAVVVHRRDEATWEGRNWIREDPLVHPYKWLRLDLVRPAPFLQCQPHLTLGGSGAC